jgi:hypothetical protein
MNKYKLLVWIIRLINTVVILLTLAIVFVPIYLFYQKPESLTTLSLLTDDTSQFDWLIEHEKVDVTQDQNADFIIIGDQTAFDQTFTEAIKHEIILYDHLFSTLDEITYKQTLLAEATGIDYTGYSGKAYQDLSDRTEIPEKIISNYEADTGTTWQFSGEGIILHKLEKTIVFVKGRDYEKTIMLNTDGHSIPFWGNFEITSSDATASVEATFEIQLTGVGKNRMKAYGLSAVFPAFYKIENPLYTAYYAAGNFSAFRATVPYFHEWLPDILSHKGLYERYSLEQTYWQWFYPTMAKLIDGYDHQLITSAEATNQFYIDGTQIYMRGTNEPFFVKGMNIGAAMPNKAFTEFPTDKSIYMTWLQQIKDLGVNTVRVYTLLPPVFYEALYTFNAHQEEPLYLLQEIWPEENPADDNYLAEAYNTIYHQEITYVVNAMHGNENIPFRNYRAYGLYQYDVSPYLIGYLVGRELEPDEVTANDALNSGYHFEGNYLFGEPNASPTENWLAGACDFTLETEAQYGNTPLVGIVNWPTLDPLEHDSEWNAEGDKTKQYNDYAVVDINHIGIRADKVSGFFGAYHIYPNYPDFMNNDAQYNQYYDSEGRFRYGGYLNAFMKLQTRYPAIVAEYGLSTSTATAHVSPDGYNHGGLSETEQADGIIRMTKAIVKEGYAGAIIFEWMDEWAKKTWTTEPYMIPYASNAFWHNLLDPEQNYGLLKYAPLGRNDIRTAYRPSSASAPFDKISTAQDAEAIYLYIDTADSNFEHQSFSLRISTPSEADSESDFWEFNLAVEDIPDSSEKNAVLTVNPGYNWPMGYYRAIDAPLETFEPLLQLVNGESTSRTGIYTPTIFTDLGQLNIGALSDIANSVTLSANRIAIKLPYGLIGISDPTTCQILSDDQYQLPTLQDQIQTKTCSAIRFEFVLDDVVYPFSMTLKPWTEAQATAELKSSYIVLQQYFKSLSSYTSGK